MTFKEEQTISDIFRRYLMPGFIFQSV
ncbi:uncharacterized protein METZ01_LOCUS200682, partial [marine metagenome]